MRESKWRLSWLSGLYCFGMILEKTLLNCAARWKCNMVFMKKIKYYHLNCRKQVEKLAAVRNNVNSKRNYIFFNEREIYTCICVRLSSVLLGISYPALVPRVVGSNVGPTTANGSHRKGSSRLRPRIEIAALPKRK